MKISRCLSLGICMAVGVGGVPALAGGYRYYFVAPPGGDGVAVTGLNDYDDVVGYFNGNNAVHGFTLIHGVYTQIDAKDGLQSRLFDINNRGVAVGIYLTADGQSMLFTHDTRTGAETATASPDPRLSFESAKINAAGVIAGTLVSKHQEMFTFLRNASGVRIIARPPGSHGSYQPASINSTATIAGTYNASNGIDSFVFKAGLSKTYSLPGANDTQLTEVTDTGAASGSYFRGSGNRHGFIAAGGVVKTYDYPGKNRGCYVAGITARGDAVGAWVPNGFTTSGFVYAGGSFHSFVIPTAAKGQITIGKVNASGSLIGSVNTATAFDRQFVAVCRRDQIPCTQ